MDWDAGSYDSFQHLRLRPAADLLAQVPDALPPGPVVDLGCGTGAAAPLLAGRFPDRMLVGIDRSDTMLEQAERGRLYDQILRTDIADWDPALAPALIFSNAVLHWLPDHSDLLPRLARHLFPRGVLAVQMPRQLGRPSHDLIHRIAGEMFPDRFDGAIPVQVQPPEHLHRLLAPFGALSVWETDYLQILSASDDGHPVRRFTQSTAARPVLERLDEDERMRFLRRYDAALGDIYPAEDDGRVQMPFRRQFFVLHRGEN